MYDKSLGLSLNRGSHCTLALDENIYKDISVDRKSFGSTTIKLESITQNVWGKTNKSIRYTIVYNLHNCFIIAENYIFSYL